MNRPWILLACFAALSGVGTSSCSEEEKPDEVEGMNSTGGSMIPPPPPSMGGGPGVMLPQGGEPSTGSGGDTSPSGLCGGFVCGALEECQQNASGDFECVRVACDTDVDCPEAKYCDGKVCVDDVCQPGEQSCDGNDVLVCEP